MPPRPAGAQHLCWWHFKHSIDSGSGQICTGEGKLVWLSPCMAIICVTKAILSLNSLRNNDEGGEMNLR